jgi:hypothetical protein
LLVALGVELAADAVVKPGTAAEPQSLAQRLLVHAATVIEHGNADGVVVVFR